MTRRPESLRLSGMLHDFPSVVCVPTSGDPQNRSPRQFISTTPRSPLHHPTQPATMTSLISKQLAEGILARPFLKSLAIPFANWYANAAGHRKLGLR